MVDEITYFDQAPWPPEADGASNSLHRSVDYNFRAVGDNPESWIADAPNPGDVVIGVTLIAPVDGADFIWPWEAFKTNPNKRIIQVGWWLQRMHALYMLEESDYEKVYIMNFSLYASQVFEKERQALKQKSIYFDFMKDSVVHINKASNTEYLNTSKGNIAFVHYHDVNVPGLVLECISTHTPILVNALPSVIEYLGRDYPLYYYSYVDAVEKASDFGLIKKAHEHLKIINQREELQLNYFVNVFRNLCLEERTK